MEIKEQNKNKKEFPNKNILKKPRRILFEVKKKKTKKTGRNLGNHLKESTRIFFGFFFFLQS